MKRQACSYGWIPAIDMISEGNYATEEIVDGLGLDLSKPIVLFTQHSVTTEFDRARSKWSLR